MSFTFPLDSSQYELLHFLGSGTYSNVYVARCIPNNRLVAVKQIDLEQCPLDIATLRADISFWSSTTHPNMISYICSFVEGSVLWFLTEYVDGGSVLDIIHFSFQTGLRDEVLLATILRGVIQFLVHFHEQRRIHRDIRTNNILLTSDGNVKVGGFWISASLIESGQRKRARFTVVGTPGYAAPEVLEGTNGYTQTADIWSLGITAIEMATGVMPFSDMYEYDQVQAIVHGDPPTLPEECKFSSAFKDFVKQCLTKRADKRPTAKELLSHKFIKGAKNSEYIAGTLMSQIPSLHQRIASTKKTCPKCPPKETHPKPEFDFGAGDEKQQQPPPATTPPQEPGHEEEGKTVKKGRFTVTVLNT